MAIFGGDDSGGGLSGLLNFFTGGGGGGGGGSPAPAQFAEQPQQKSWSDIFLPAALGGGAGLLGMLLNRGANKDIKSATKDISGISRTTIPAGRQMVERAAAGKLTDVQQAAVDRMKAEQMAKWNQYLSGLGIPMSSSQVQAANLVESQALEEANKFINESMRQGTELLGAGGTASQQLLTNAMQQKKDLSKTIWDVAAEIGRVINAPQKPGQPQQGAQTTVPAELASVPGAPEQLAGPPEDPYAALFGGGSTYT